MIIIAQTRITHVAIFYFDVIAELRGLLAYYPLFRTFMFFPSQVSDNFLLQLNLADLASPQVLKHALAL